MRKQNVIIGLSTAFLAFGTLYLLVIHETPQIVRWYCVGQPHNNDFEVDQCVESHPTLASLRGGE